MSTNQRKGAEAKFYPNTTITIEKYLMVAKERNDHVGAATVLTPKTIARLNAIQPLYRQTRQNVFKYKGERSSIVAQKEGARSSLALHVSHFLQVFNMGIKRGKYSFSERVLFGMDAHSDTLPNLKGDSNIRAIAEKIIDGEARRIADGKEAVSNPSGAEVEAQFNVFESLTHRAANADDLLNDEQKKLRSLHKEARAVVKKVWREVETFYNEGDRERMRKWAREWGVHYARKGGEKVVEGTITDAATGLPLGGVKVKFKNGKNKTHTDSYGKFTLVTNLLHSQTITAALSGYHTAEGDIELKEGEENFCALKMEREN